MQIDGDHVRNTPDHGIASGEEAAIDGAVANGDHPFWGWRRAIGTLQGLAHIFGHWAGDEKHIGVSRRGDKLEAKALKIVESIVQGVDFEFATVAGASVDLTNRKASSKPTLCRSVQLSREFSQFGIVRYGLLLRQRRADQSAKEQLAHLGPSKIVPRIGAVERFVAEWKVGDDVSLNCCFQQRPLEPGWIA